MNDLVAAVESTSIADYELLRSGNTFLSEIANRSTTISLQNGALIEIVRKSKRNKPLSPLYDGVCYFEMTSTLKDGTVIQPTIRVTKSPKDVVKGLGTIMQYMVVGDRWKIFLPYDLHYGASGRWEAGIPPFSPLIYVVEILEIFNIQNPSAGKPAEVARKAFESVKLKSSSSSSSSSFFLSSSSTSTSSSPEAQPQSQPQPQPPDL